jgi:arsenite methyltransferase
MSFINNPESSTDVWLEWLTHVRNGGDAAFEQILRLEIEGYVDRILDQANIRSGMTLLDVGAGEGTVALRAIERFGPTLRLILTDVSEPLLLRARAHAVELGVQDQCTFILCGADQLAGIENESVDVVTTRSALAYVHDKARALREFNRVLKPGGRISLGEPVFQDDAYHACVLKSLTEKGSTTDRLTPLLHRWKAAQFPDTPEGIAVQPLTNFSERTLFEMTRAAGFSPVHLEFHMDLCPSRITSWHVFLHSSPHPLAPALIDILDERFTVEERQIFEAVFKPLVESGCAMTLSRMAFVSATKAVAQTMPPI